MLVEYWFEFAEDLGQEQLVGLLLLGSPGSETDRGLLEMLNTSL